MSTDPANHAQPMTNAGSSSKKKTMTHLQLAAQAAATADQQPEGVKTANGRRVRDTMAAKNGRVAENILRERALGEEFVARGGSLTDGNNTEARLKTLGVPVDAAGRSPSSLVAAASSSPLSEQDRFSYRRGPPQTPTRTPSHLSTVAQPSDTPPNASLPTLSHHPPPTTTGSSSTRTANPSSNTASTTAPSASATATATATTQDGSHGNAPSNPIPPTRSAPSHVITTPTAPKPSSPTRPATVLNPNPVASMPGTSNPSTNTLEDPWAPITNVPVRIEVGKAEDFKNPLAPTTTLYVTVPSITRLGDHYHCKLSDVMTKVADLESPLKQRTSKVYRLGPDNELVRLGRGNDLADPSNTSLADNAFLDDHRIKRTEKEGVEVFTGIKIFYEHKPSGPSVRPPQEEPLPRRDRSASQQERTNHSGSNRATANPSSSASRSISKRSTANASTSASRNKHHRRQPSPSSPDEDDDEGPFDPEDELYPFIRNIFGLQSDNLPGHWDVRTARDALDRYDSVCRGEILAKKLHWKIPGEESLTVLREGHEDRDVEVPEAIRGRAFTKTDLQRVYGFNDTTWWTLGQRWTKSNLKGARTVQAWVEDPDATVQNSDEEEEEKYPHLNQLPFNKLKSVISLDRADSGEHVARDGGRRREDRTRQREQRRRQSSSSHHSRSPSARLQSNELDDPEPRQGRKTGSRRSGGR